MKRLTEPGWTAELGMSVQMISRYAGFADKAKDGVGKRRPPRTGDERIKNSAVASKSSAA